MRSLRWFLLTLLLGAGSTNAALHGVPPATGGTLSGDSSATTATATGGSSSRTLASHFGDALSVKDFGAVCDGSTNDTSAIQTAINTVGAAGGGTLLIPPTVCSVTDLTIRYANVTLQGTEGSGVFAATSGGSILKARSGTTVVLSIGAANPSATSVAAVTVDSISIDGNSFATGGIFIADTNGSVFRNLHISGASSYAMKLAYVDGAATGLPYVYSSAFENIWLVASAAGDGLYLTGAPTSPVQRAAFCSFKHMHITYKNGDGIRMDNADDNSFYNIGMSQTAGGTGYGIELDGTGASAQQLVHTNHFFFVWPGPGGIFAHGSKAVRNTFYAISTEDGPIPITVNNSATAYYIKDDGTSALGAITGSTIDGVIGSVTPASITGTTITANSGFIYPTVAFASLPSAAASTGAVYNVSNANNTLWKSDGTNWRPVGGCALIYRKSGSLASPIATISASTAARFSISGGNPTIPANMLLSGTSRINVRALVRKNGANGTWNLNARLGTADSTADQLLQQSSETNVNDRQHYIFTDAFVSGAAAFTPTNFLVPNSPGTTAATDKTGNFSVASANLVSFDISAANASDSFDLVSASVEVCP